MLLFVYHVLTESTPLVSEVLAKLVHQTNIPTPLLAIVAIVQLVLNQIPPEMVANCVLPVLMHQKTQYVNCVHLELFLHRDLVLALLVVAVLVYSTTNAFYVTPDSFPRMTETAQPVQLIPYLNEEPALARSAVLVLIQR